GLLTVVNFAHGSFYMLGAYFGFFLFGLTGNFWVSLAVAPLMVGSFGLLVERFLVRPLYGRSIDDPLLLTFGLSLVLIEAARLVWGKIGVTFDPPRELGQAVNLGFTLFPAYRLFVIGVTAAVLSGLMIGEVVGLTTLVAPKLSEIMVFIVMAVVLLVRPSGLLGEAGLLE